MEIPTAQENIEKKCCNGRGLFGKCGFGTKEGCTGAHCKCMNLDGLCANMHYADCKEHYIHVEHIEPPTETGEIRNSDGTFKPGVSGNPGGRPPQVSITAAIKKMLTEKFPIRKCRCECHFDKTALDNRTIIPGKPRNETCRLCEAIHEEIEEDKELQRTYLDKTVRAIFENGIISKDQKALKDIWSYIDGLPKGSFDLGVDREGLAEMTEFLRLMANPKKPDEEK